MAVHRTRVPHEAGYTGAAALLQRRQYPATATPGAEYSSTQHRTVPRSGSCRFVAIWVKGVRSDSLWYSKGRTDCDFADNNTLYIFKCAMCSVKALE